MQILQSLWQHPVVRILASIVVLYFGFILLLAVFQRSLIYYPTTLEDAVQRKQAIAKGWSPWIDPDGERIGWRIRLSDEPGQLIIFHGNAGNALLREYWVRAFATIDETSFGTIYIFEYPGYGGRPGKPSQTAFETSARAALENKIHAADAGNRPLHLLGESIGTGVAAWLAAQYPDAVDGLILVTPFTQLSEVAHAHFPYLPVGLFLQDNYAPQRDLRAYPPDC